MTYTTIGPPMTLSFDPTIKIPQVDKIKDQINDSIEKINEHVDELEEDIDFLGEGHTTTKNDITYIFKELDKINQTLRKFYSNYATLEERVKKLESKFL